jgi:RNA polymerase sigma-70 factor, ECF subfamily
MNKEAFEILIRENKALVEKVVSRYCGSGEDTRDLVSSIWAKSFSSCDRLETKEDFPKWVSVIARNCCIDYLRVKRRDVSLEVIAEEETSSEDTTIKSVSDGHNNGVLARALGLMDETDRFIIVLHHIKGESVKAIGRKLGLSVGAVKVKLYRAREKLRDLIREDL